MLNFELKKNFSSANSVEIFITPTDSPVRSKSQTRETTETKVPQSPKRCKLVKKNNYYLSALIADKYFDYLYLEN